MFVSIRTTRTRKSPADWNVLEGVDPQVGRFARVGLVVLVVAVLFTATACKAKVYSDGTYQAVSQANDKGYTWAKVVVENDKIKSVELKEFTGTGVEKDWATYPYVEAKSANEAMPGRFVQKNSWDVDVFAKATSSSDKYKEAVKLALEKAKAKPTTTTAYFNGTFMGKSAVDGRGSWGIVWVTIQNDKITAVNLAETYVTGGETVLKSADTYAYVEWHGAKAELPARFVAAGPSGVASVNAFAGATSSTDKWKAAMQNALANAKVK